MNLGFLSLPVRFTRNGILLVVGGSVALLVAVLTLASNVRYQMPEHYILLAQSFLQGHLYLAPGSWHNDVSWFLGFPYWAAGPWPAVLAMPGVWFFTLFGWTFHQGYMQLIFLLITLWCLFKLARWERFSLLDAGYFAFAIFIDSPLFHTAAFPSSYYLAHVVTLGLLFWAIYEYLARKRYWFVGVLMGAVLATRATAGLGVVFFAADILVNSTDSARDKLRHLMGLLAPVVFTAVLLGWYDYARFGNWLEQGYSFQTLAYAGPSATHAYGLFSLVHLPANLYYLLLAAPLPVFKSLPAHVLTFPYVVPNLWGMSIFITSPYLLALFFFRYHDTRSKLLLLTSATVALPILLYYGIGVEQFGYRYALDFLPWLLWLLMREYRQVRPNLSYGFRALIVSAGR